MGDIHQVATLLQMKVHVADKFATSTSKLTYQCSQLVARVVAGFSYYHCQCEKGGEISDSGIFVSTLWMTAVLPSLYAVVPVAACRGC